MYGVVELGILAVGIAAIVILTAKLRVHAFLALLSVSIGIGFLLGLPSSQIIKDIVDGFGGTLGYVGLIVFEATIIGELVTRTGAASAISRSLLRIFGKSRTATAIGTAGYLVAPPVTCNDTAFLILSPVAKTLSGAGGSSAPFIGLVLAAGVYSSFKLVFPAAPLYAATIFHADLASIILFGFLISIPVFAVGYAWVQVYARYGHLSKSTSTTIGEQAPSDVEQMLPRATSSFGVIAIPLMLILARSLLEGYLSGSPIWTWVEFLGHPVLAMLAGIGVAVFLARGYGMERVTEWVSNGFTRAASIVAIVGAGGILGRILLDAKIGQALGYSLTSIGLTGPIVVFLVAAIIKTAQGSSVVTMVTAPSILLPLLPSLGVSPTFATLLVSAGAMISIHLNDSYFWIVTGFSQLSVVEGIKTLTIMSVVQGLTALLLVLSLAHLVAI